ncbi:hypothetical protein RB595_007259 [Gaeumannomyces hyphopodioides]
MAIRLINTETLRMKMFVDASVPEYAILSHTWVEDEEVDFQEMTRYGAASQENDPTAAEGVCTCVCHCQSLISDTVRRRSGYEKIVRTCRLAKECDIKWAWVDTCCIDKSSSAELSEAINSMYKWYNKAKVCFVFFADLDSHSEPEELEEALGRCRWFTRGWTLQELIAPEKIEFYNRHWRNVGSKATLQKALDKASGIRNLYQMGGYRMPQEVAVAERMSWASRRQTTRVEDMAYCLLGIFDIHMPLLYGEGEKAFQRLQEAILKRSNDTSIFCISAQHAREFGFYGADGWDVLATSPKAFDGLPDVVPPSLFVNKRWSQTTFSVTNRGLLVQNAYLIPCSGNCAAGSYYVLELNCTQEVGNSWQQSVMFLRWISPSCYMRIQGDRPLPRCVITGDGADSQMGLTEDFYILTWDAYTESWKRDVYSYIRSSDSVELEPGPPLSQLRMVQASPPQYWDVAARRFMGAGLGYAKFELASYTGGETVWVAAFHVAFFMERSKEVRARLYSADEWQEAKGDLDRLSRGGCSRLPDWLSFTTLGNSGASDWLLTGTDLRPYREGGLAPVRARVASSQRKKSILTFSREEYVQIEVQWLQNDGTYSSDVSGFNTGQQRG